MNLCKLHVLVVIVNLFFDLRLNSCTTINSVCFPTRGEHEEKEGRESDTKEERERMARVANR